MVAHTRAQRNACDVILCQYFLCSDFRKEATGFLCSAVEGRYCSCRRSRFSYQATQSGPKLPTILVQEDLMISSNLHRLLLSHGCTYIYSDTYITYTYTAYYRYYKKKPHYICMHLASCLEYFIRTSSSAQFSFNGFNTLKHQWRIDLFISPHKRSS